MKHFKRRSKNLECSIQDTLHPICSCGEDIENSSHYLRHCPNYSQERITYLNIVSCFVAQLSEILLYDKEDLDNIYDTSMLDATINYLIETKSVHAEHFLCSPDVMALTLILLLKFICLFFFVCFFSFYYYYLLSFLGYFLYFIYIFFCSRVYYNIYMHYS